jgi:hypothetical protein
VIGGPTISRLLKPVLAGVALAYLVTAFVDKPAPVDFQPMNPYASAQSKIVAPQVDLVMEKNIMKLGSPLSATPETVAPEANPLAGLEGGAGDDAAVTGDNATVAVPVIRDAAKEEPASESQPPSATPPDQADEQPSSQAGGSVSAPPSAPSAPSAETAAE